MSNTAHYSQGRKNISSVIVRTVPSGCMNLPWISMNYPRKAPHTTFTSFLIPLFTPSFGKKMSDASTVCEVPSATAENVLFFFNAGDFHEDPYCFSPLSCEVEPNYVGRILPVEVKMNSTHKDFWNNSQQRHPPPPSPRLGKMLSL